MLTREECEKALTRLYRPLFVSTRIQNAFYRVNGNEYSINDDSNLLEQLIKEHFDPQPYKFEELHEGMWVWDDVEKKCNKIININTVKLLLPTSNSDKKIGFYYITENPLRYIVEFEENRFFPVTKAKGE